MAMVVKNNMSAVRTLGTLNKNSAALSKSLGKVSSGQKINSAADDASGYSISERMRVMIRSLNQADENTKNGLSMMKVAEGAVSSTVDILKTMKEKAINAANDSNTDSDRATIQKELDQSIDQIDDNALITYNGKTLVDGSKMAKGIATKTSLTNQSLSEDTTGNTKLVDLANRNGEGLNIQTTDKLTISYVIQGRTYSVDVDIDENTNLNSALQKAQMAYTMDSPAMSGATAAYHAAEAAANNTYAAAKAAALANYNAAKSAAATTRNNDINNAVATRSTTLATATVTYSTAVVTGNSTVTYSGSTYNIADAVVKASTDAITAPQYYNRWQEPNSTMIANTGDNNYDYAYRDGNRWEYSNDDDMGTRYSRSVVSANAALYSTNAVDASNSYTTLSTNLVSTVGLATSTYNSSYTSAWSTYNSTEAVAHAAYNSTVAVASTVQASTVGVATSTWNAALDAALSTYQDQQGDVVPYKVPITASDVVGKAASGDTVYTANREKALTITAASGGVKYQISGLTFSVSDSEGKVKKSVNAVLDNFSESVRAVNKSEDNAITLQVGTRANQSIKIGLTDMRTEALGLKSSDGTTLSVGTQKDANAAINVLDNAIQKALDQQTDIGSIESRLEMTSANLVTASENVQFSESTIRDADMAREMTEYTKNNILLQAAQSMLAQANQSSSNVLSLLQ